MYLCWRKVLITFRTNNHTTEYWPYFCESVFIQLFVTMFTSSKSQTVLAWFWFCMKSNLWGKLYISVSQRWGLIQENFHTRGSSKENWGTTHQPYWEVNTSILHQNSLLDASFSIWILSRMHKDGRQPHTFRLTIRRYTVTNRWFNRESRQCPIPNHTGLKITCGTLLFFCML